MGLRDFCLRNVPSEYVGQGLGPAVQGYEGFCDAAGVNPRPTALPEGLQNKVNTFLFIKE